MIVGQYYTGHIIFLLCRTDIKINFLHVCINPSPPSNFFFAPVFTNVSRSASYSVLLMMASESLQQQMRIFFFLLFFSMLQQKEREFQEV